MTENKESQNQSAQSEEFEALYVQSAGGMAYENGRLTLSGIAPTTLYFSDRPDRITGHIPTEEFLDTWGEGDDSFADDPPNAVLSIFSEEEVNDVVVVLQDPALDGDQMSYQVDILDGEMPSGGGANSLFIDVIGRPMTPGSVAGVRRRGRRRGRRRARRRARRR
ncbi:MAG: hypothetical protein AMJ56_03705 [Anaerolineae bacterium SG8_19]|jgi:hypothetical protein|nr:MAG: hypothetical protein AMJ56_03705 [Anaerolineae bacterium SG8_19]